MIQATLQFEVNTFQTPSKNRPTNGKPLWTVRKEFKDDNHLDNFINHIEKTKGYTIDEVFIHHQKK